jgi:preprotein translocase subunit YajC
MKVTTIVYIFLAFIAIIGYNVFLIQRDQQMFQKYDHERSISQSINV